jgi:hypothetical protein
MNIRYLAEEAVWRLTPGRVKRRKRHNDWMKQIEDGFVLPGRQGVLINVHDPSACEGEGCPIHHPSDHHMVDWPLVWQGGGPFDIWAGFERECPHGIGHLDPDTEAFMRRTGQFVPSHGCDGCCDRT